MDKKVSLLSTSDIIVLKQSKIEKNGKTLEGIPFVMSKFKQQITTDLLDFFNINIKLDSYNVMKREYIKDNTYIGITNIFIMDLFNKDIILLHN